MKPPLLLATAVLLALVPRASAQAPALQTPRPTEIRIDASKVLRKVDRHKFLGTNVGLWHTPQTLGDPRITELLRQVGPGLIRLPGGGMSDMYFWNGNGVRKGNNTPDAVDRSRYRQNAWDIDYSAWAPGFNGFSSFPADPISAKLGTWHGNVDVKQLHDFVRSAKAQQVVTVNGGTGTPRDAAEWVKWANGKMGYGITWWEVGNELDQGGEPGAIRPDGQHMDGKLYAELFRQFAEAMKKEDPQILVGGPVSSSPNYAYVADLLEHAGDQVGFVSYHDYYTPGEGTAEEMFAKLSTIRPTARQMRDLCRKYQPARAERIPIGLTEWDSKLYDDVYTADLFNGLWSAAALGEMLGSDLDFACQWDAFTQSPDHGGGHGMVIEAGPTPKSQYWAFYMVSQYFGDEILQATSADKDLRVYASRGQSGSLCLMGINTSTQRDITATLQTEGFALPAWCEAYTFSTAQYKWEPIAFSTLWNTGPARATRALGPSHQFTFPAWSVTILRLPAGQVRAASLRVLGPDRLDTAAGQNATIEVLALDADGRPRAGQEVSAVFHDGKFALKQAKATTSAHGTAAFVVSAPAETGTDTLVVSCDGTSAQYSVSAADPELRVVVPAKSPDDEPVLVGIYALRKGAGPIAGLGGSFSLTGPAGTTLGTFKDGMARVDLGRLKPGKYTLKAQITVPRPATAEREITVYAQEERDRLALGFDAPADMEHVSGTGGAHLDSSVRANQAVLALKLTNCTGFTRDLLNLVKLNELRTINWDKVVAVTFDMKVGDDYTCTDGPGDMSIVLASAGNYWMPLKTLPLSTQKKGEWSKVRLEIDKPDWQKAMAGFFKVYVVFQGSGKQNGTLYLDNLAFVERTERQ